MDFGFRYSIALLKRGHFDRSESRQIGTNEAEKSVFNRFPFGALRFAPCLGSAPATACAVNHGGFARNDDFRMFSTEQNQNVKFKVSSKAAAKKRIIPVIDGFVNNRQAGGEFYLQENAVKSKLSLVKTRKKIRK